MQLMKKAISFLFLAFIALGCFSQSVSYKHAIFKAEGCQVTLSVAKQDTSYYIISTVLSDRLTFLDPSTMLLKNYKDEVIKLFGTPIGNSSDSGGGVIIGGVVLSSSEIRSTA